MFLSELMPRIGIDVLGSTVSEISWSSARISTATVFEARYFGSKSDLNVNHYI